jgi:hypothetical protein
VRIDRIMASSTSGLISFSGAESALPAPTAETRRRRISPEAGRAIEKLAHAIEYLSDEFVQDSGPLHPHDGRVEAIQLLMSLNRAVYCECPEMKPGVGGGLRDFLCRLL